MESFEAVLADIAKRFEVLDVAYLNDFVGPCHPDFYAGIKTALGSVTQNHARQTVGCISAPYLALNLLEPPRLVGGDTPFICHGN